MRPEAFGFFGFDGQEAGVAKRLQRLAMWGGEPTMTVVDDGVFLPTEIGRRGDQPKASGGVFAADGSEIGAARLRRKGRTLPDRRRDVAASQFEAEVDEEVVYLGPLFAHYGRLLLESLSRVWVLDRVEPKTKIVFDAPNGMPTLGDGWLTDVLDLFGLPRQRIIVLDRPTRLRRAIVPDPLFEQMHAAHPGFVAAFRQVAERIAGDTRPSVSPLYLSRRLLSSRQRVIVGEAALEDLLRENGFVVAYPETMPFAEQVRLVNRHPQIFSSVGSAAHTALFGLARPTLHLLTYGAQIPTNYLLCSAVAEIPTTFVNCLGTGDRPDFAQVAQGAEESGTEHEQGPAKAQAVPQLLDPRTLVAYLEANGLLRQRVRSTLIVAQPPGRDCYDEAWLYARVRKAIGKHGLPLPASVEAAARQAAATSWPLNWVLARHDAVVRQDATSASAFAARFADLAAAETDIDRVAHHRAEIAGTSTKVLRFCDAATAAAVRAVIADRFGINEDGAEGRRPGRRGV